MAGARPPVGPSRPAIFICVVNYHQDKATIAFAERVQAIGGGLTHCLIVDNSLSLQGNDALRARIEALPGATLLLPSTNLGYYGGGRFGFAAAQAMSGQTIPSRWFVVCNTDIEFPDPEFFAKLCALDTAGHGVIAPDVRKATHAGGFDTGEQQNPFMRLAPSRAFLRRRLMIFSHPILYALLELASYAKRRILPRREPVQTPARIYAPHGCFVIFSEQYFAKGASLDFGGFLYGEEIFVGQDAARAGVSVQFVPSLRLVHVGGETTLHLTSGNRAKFQASSLAWLLARQV